MKDFNIAKYLKEHSLGSHGILSHYIDLQPLKEEKVPVKKTGIYPSKESAQKVADVCTTGGMKGVEVREVGNGKFKVFAYPGQERTNEDHDLGQQDAMPEPYEGPEDPIDGLGDNLNRYMDVSMNEEDDIEDSRIMDLGGDQIEQGIISLLSDGFDTQDIMNLVKYIIDTHLGTKAMGKRF